MDISLILKEKTELIEKNLLNYFPQKNNLQKNIYEAMGYSLFVGGKRVRPVLAVSVCEMLGGEAKDVMPFACALEMIHTYSLIHDDLPAMDNDDFRRGKPTNHKVYGEATAILAGDALLNCAFETALKFSEVSAETTLDCLNVLANAAGTEGMIGGQIIDLEHENKETNADVLENMHLLKTGALISATAKMGAICADAPNADVFRMNEFAKCLGLAFQIKDDILDVEGNAEVLGKPIGSDAENKKTTYVTLYGLDEAKKMLMFYTQKAIELLEAYKERSEFLKEFALYLLKRNN